MKEQREKKSPLKTTPLREAGQSAREQRDDYVMGKAFFWVIFPMVTILFAGFEWVRWWRKMSPDPVLWTVIAVLACAVAVWQMFVTKRKAQPMNLGVEGEQVVGQRLEELRSAGYKVFHDIPGDGFNVDHVIVGPGGVFVVETKTRSKSAGPDVKVVYDGKTLTVDGIAPDRDAIAQVKAASSYVEGIIKRSTGHEVEAQPVVLFPGWYTKQPKRPDVWVLNETVFPQWVEGAWDELDGVTVNQIADSIRMHVENKSRAL